MKGTFSHTLIMPAEFPEELELIEGLTKVDVATRAEFLDAKIRALPAQERGLARRERHEIDKELASRLSRDRLTPFHDLLEAKQGKVDKALKTRPEVKRALAAAYASFLELEHDYWSKNLHDICKCAKPCKPPAAPKDSWHNEALRKLDAKPYFASGIAGYRLRRICPPDNPKIGNRTFRASQRLITRLWCVYLWPEVLAWWRKNRAAPAFRVPAPLVTGKDPVIQAFGRRHDKGAGINISSESIGGRTVEAMVIVGRHQLELFHPELERLSNPTGAELVRLIGRLLTPRDLRVLMACFAAAEEDNGPGGVRGAFYYSPTRFADLLGYTRAPNSSKAGKTAATRHREGARGEMDKRLANLGNVKLEATVRMAGRTRTVTAEQLVIDGHASLEESTSKKGRRKARLYQVNAHLLMLLDAAGGEGWYFNLPVAALAAPSGVHQRTWDDAFKLALVLYGYARRYAPAARTEAALPWDMRLEDVLTVANVVRKGRGKAERMAKGRRLLELLEESGLVMHRLEGELVRFSTAADSRRDLASIALKRPELPAPTRKRRKPRPKK